MMNIKKSITILLTLIASLCLSHQVQAKPDQVGVASYYGKPFHGRLTANGERYNMYGMTAASNKFKFGTRLKVTCLTTKKSVIVRVNDTGAFTRKYNRVIDLSYGSAKALDMIDRGLTKVRIDVLNQ